MYWLNDVGLIVKTLYLKGKRLVRVIAKSELFVGCDCNIA